MDRTYRRRHAALLKTGRAFARADPAGWIRVRSYRGALRRRHTFSRVWFPNWDRDFARGVAQRFACLHLGIGRSSAGAFEEAFGCGLLVKPTTTSYLHQNIHDHDKRKTAISGGLTLLRTENCSVLIVAGALPIHDLAQRRGRTRDRLLVSLDIRSACFFTDCAKTESDLLLFRIHFNDLKVVLLSRLKLDRSAVRVGGLGVVAESFHAIRNLYKSAELSGAQHFSTDDIANPVCRKERLPDIGLHLLDA